MDPEGEVVDAPYLLLATGKALAVDNDGCDGDDNDNGEISCIMSSMTTIRGVHSEAMIMIMAMII